PHRTPPPNARAPGGAGGGRRPASPGGSRCRPGRGGACRRRRQGPHRRRYRPAPASRSGAAGAGSGWTGGPRRYGTPCAGRGSTTGWAGRRNTRGRSPAHRPAAGAPATGRRRSPTVRRARAGPPWREGRGRPAPGYGGSGDAPSVLPGGAERAMAGQGARMAGDCVPLLRTPFPQRLAEYGIDRVVVAVHQGGEEAPGQLVLALGARFETGESLLQAVLDALVVAGLEMQAREGDVAAPVAPVERVAAAQAERSGHRLPVQICKYHQYVARHCSRKISNELPGQRRRVAVLEEGLQVEAVDRVQLGRAGLVAVQATERHPGA